MLSCEYCEAFKNTYFGNIYGRLLLFIAYKNNELFHYQICTGSPALISFYSIVYSFFLTFCGVYDQLKIKQPILAKKIYDIYKFQIFKKITIFRNILKIRRLCLDCICHFQRATSQGYIISIGHRKLAGYLQLTASFALILGCQGNKHLIIFNLIQHFTGKMAGNLICGKVFIN